MARPLRLEFEVAVYHVMSRGHERGKIFADDGDRTFYLEQLRRVVEEKQWLVHGYCLMSNHAHLLIETPLGNLSLGMQMLNGRYGAAFNRRHGRTGHLLEGRFHAVLVEKDSYLLELSRYIVLNPVRARMVARPGDWKWSSYRATSGQAEAPSWLTVDWTLAQFGRSRPAAREAYRRFVAEGKGARSPLEDVRGQVFLGGEAFLKEMSSRVMETKPGSDFPRAQRELISVPLDRIREAVAAEFGVDAGDLKRRRGGADKVAALYLSRRLSGLGGREIGEAFGVTAGRVSHVAKQIEGGEWPELKEVL